MSVTLDEWGNPMPVSVACRITKNGDEPIKVKNRIPYFTRYDAAYQFAEHHGYSTDKESNRELCIVIEGGLELLKSRFGELVPSGEVL